jgi:MFS family permease
MNPAAPLASGNASPAGWYALAVLALTTFLALLDRQVLLLLAEPVRVELLLSDLEVGLLQGTGVALFAAIAGFPLAWLADRYDRRIVLSACVVVWCAGVFASGLTMSFPSLFAATAIVGIGEAGLAPVMYSLIPLFFFGRQRQLANSIAVIATVGGGALAFLIAGQLVGLSDVLRPFLPAALSDSSPWRIAFFAAALPAPLMVLLIMSVRMPDRGAQVPLPVDAESISAGDAGLVSARAYFRMHAATYARFYFGNGFGGFAFVAISVWVAIIAARMFEQSPAQIGSALGIAQIGSVGLGFILSVAATRHWHTSVGGRLPVRLMWVGILVAMVASLSLLWVRSATALFLCYGLIGVALSFASMLFPTGLQNLSPQHLRGRATSLQFFVSLSLSATAAPLVGFVSDQLGSRPNAPLIAVVMLSVPALFLAAMLLWWCERAGLDAAIADATRIDSLAPTAR